MTNNTNNIKTINGSLVLTVNQDKYFDGDFTSATIVSKQTFEWKDTRYKLLIKYRAAFDSDAGIYPRIFLISYDQVAYDKYNFITVLNYQEKRLWNGLWPENSEIMIKNLTYQDFTRLQYFEFEYFENNYKWRLNQIDYITKDNFDLTYPNKKIFQRNKRGMGRYHWTANLPWHYFHPKLKLVITLHIDHNRVDELKQLDCASLIIDSIRVYKINSTEKNEIRNDLTDDKLNIKQICVEQINKSRNRNNMEKFSPDDTLQFVWSDEFEGNQLNETLWTILGNTDRCQSL